MNGDRIEGNWKLFMGNLTQQLDKPSTLEDLKQSIVFHLVWLFCAPPVAGIL